MSGGIKMTKERNCDKIRRLEKELREERERRKNADLEIMRMHGVVDKARQDALEQLGEISMAADAFGVQTALSYGTCGEAGEYTIRLPRYSAPELMGKYTITGERVGGGRMFTVREKERKDDR